MAKTEKKVPEMSPESEFDSHGRKRVQCLECGGYYHRVDVHAEKIHKLGSKAYQERYPGAEIMSEAAKQRLEDVRPHKAQAGVEKPAVPRIPVGRAFIDAIEPTDEDLPFLQIHDERWHMGPDEKRALEDLALAIELGENVLLVGPPGIGKSTLVKQFCALTRWPLRRIGFHGEMRVRELVGGTELVSNASGQSVTEWEDGPVTLAAERGNGQMILFDEFDTAPSTMSSVLHSILEDDRHLYLPARRARPLVDFKSRFRVIATANTLGFGDSSGLFAGTAPMNEALLDRFATVIRLGYPPPAEEVKILMEKTGIAETRAATMVQVANSVRELNKKDETLIAVSPRRLIYWARKTVRYNDPVAAARLSLINRLPPEDATVVSGLIQRHFGSGK